MSKRPPPVTLDDLQADGSEWREATRLPGYWLSNDGRVWRAGNQRLVSICLGQNGYLRFHWSINGKTGSAELHRELAKTFIGPPPFEGAQVAHRDDNRLNISLRNLYWATSQQNWDDRKRNRGVRKYFSAQEKMTLALMLSFGASVGEISRSLERDQRSVRHVIRRERAQCAS
jgi:hypothetical protein